MEILLDSITADPSELELTASPEELDLHLDLAALDSPVVYRLTAWKIEDEIFLDGTVTYTLRQACARCLTDFPEKYSLPMKLVLQLVPDDRLREQDDGDDEFIMISASRTTYVLDQNLRDLITLELPMKATCRSDCKGLCPKCGTNWNEQRCNCDVKEIDPRWDALKKLSDNN